MIVKEVKMEIAGKVCDKLYCKKIIEDSDPKFNLIVDAVEIIDGEEVVYYTDVALLLSEVDFLTDEEIEELKK